MNCILYKNKSDNRYARKTITPINPVGAQNPDIRIELLENTSLVDPTFIFSPQTKIYDANYLHVDELDRYYYIIDKVYSHGRMYVKCHVDVLMSYINKLSDQKCIVKRSASIYDMYLKDDETLLEAYTKTRVLEFPSGFDKDTQQFVLAVVGNTSSSSNSDSGDSNGDSGNNSSSNTGDDNSGNSGGNSGNNSDNGSDDSGDNSGGNSGGNIL